jgi:glycosyltransferase involved in cell wall biosynthesis
LNILIIHDQKLPVFTYGGTERVIWALGKELHLLGHRVTFLLPSGSSCDFANMLIWNPSKPLNDQIPMDTDIVHFQKEPDEQISKPHIVTIHGNGNKDRILHKNAVFVSQNHAQRHGSDVFVHNGLDWTEYAKPNLHAERQRFHFLGNAAWRIKNVKGAIKVIQKTPKEHLDVLGGKRFNFKMGLRFTFSPRIHFHGMVGGQQKFQLLNSSKGLIFPVLWHEPFGLAITESLFYGCPIFATPYGSLPELVNPEIGFLSNNSADLAEAILQSNQYKQSTCHAIAQELFDSKTMAKKYLSMYEKVVNGENLNQVNPQILDTNTPKFLPWNR